ncbi:YaaC family protein [Bacillus sp. 31A1R]|uniref:YaaC family protein n=1 Tax=Robertmurraya mangrovi TaxID=3098077 RepID=A0ABU5J5P7_9BACI|nr:YaaC family protein [Bacillus sp. 31A1R]MDZ5474661.1 YaaC family protein [Bacillus sp. 31A1R]
MILNFAGWTSFSLFFSASSTQAYLKKCYQTQQVEDAEQKSYENCYPFIYYLEHGQVYYEQAKNSPLIIQPILLFYGLVHLIKACILTVDPNYPETTSVLAHGVSTRKRKKQQYQFFQDEVKFQKSGLFPHMSEKLFHMKQLEGEKTTMSELFKHIPELNDLFFQLDGRKTFVDVIRKDNTFSIPLEILDYYHMTEARFLDFFQSKAFFTAAQSSVENPYLNLTLEDDNLSNYTPFKYNLNQQQFSLPINNDSLFQYHELMIQYLLLYNLSMIARYETEWWSELVKTMPNKDFPFIQTFLNITLNKGPFLIYQYLMNKK